MGRHVEIREGKCDEVFDLRVRGRGESFELKNDDTWQVPKFQCLGGLHMLFASRTVPRGYRKFETGGSGSSNQ